MVGWFVIRNIVAGSKFVYKNEHRAPQNLKNFVGDFSAVRITTNLRADTTCRAKPIPRNQQISKNTVQTVFLFSKLAIINTTILKGTNN